MLVFSTISSGFGEIYDSNRNIDIPSHLPEGQVPLFISGKPQWKRRSGEVHQ